MMTSQIVNHKINLKQVRVSELCKLQKILVISVCDIQSTVIGIGTYMIRWLIVHQLLDHGLNNRVELALNVGIVDLPAHLILIST